MEYLYRVDLGPFTKADIDQSVLVFQPVPLFVVRIITVTLKPELVPLVRSVCDSSHILRLTNFSLL